jgi:hypothetical protein
MTPRADDYHPRRHEQGHIVHDTIERHITSPPTLLADIKIISTRRSLSYACGFD